MVQLIGNGGRWKHQTWVRCCSLEGYTYMSETPMDCPDCKGPLLDLRGMGFSQTAMEREGTCVLHSASPWGAGDAYWCAHRACGNHPIQYECKVPGQTQPVMVEPPWDGKYRKRYS